MTYLTLDAAALDELKRDSFVYSDIDGLGFHTCYELTPKEYASLDAQARAALSLRDELAEGEVLRNRMGDILTLTVNALKGEPDPRSLHDWATLPDVARTLVNELAECRAKLAAQIERCGLAELAVAQRDIPLAAAQADNAALREDASLVIDDIRNAEYDMAVARLTDMLDIPTGSRAALREMLTMAVRAAHDHTAHIVSRLLGEEGGQS